MAPDIWAPLYFYHRTCKQDQAKEGGHAQPASHDINQAHISSFYYINYDCYFDKVHADNEYYYDAFLNCIGCYLDIFSMVHNQGHQVQWDPGGSVWRPLGMDSFGLLCFGFLLLP